MKKVVIYEKFIAPGHREYIFKFLKDNFHSSQYDVIYLCNNRRKENFLSALLSLYKTNKFNHCHLLTLEDCLSDFKDRKLLAKFLRLNVSLTATLFHFDILQPENLLKGLINYFLNYKNDQSLIFNLLKKGIIKAIYCPDERIRNKTLYPICNSYLEYLPDFFRFRIKKINRSNACQKLNIDEKAINFLMFGIMNDYKGLDILAEAINNNFISPLDNKINFIIAGENKKKIKFNNLSENIRIIEYDKFINDDLANILFSAADCVLLPFKRGFKISSGTFSLACAYGKFIITSAEGVLGWRVNKYNNGYVFQPSNAKSLASVINKFIVNYNKIKYPPAGSLAYAEKCSPDNYLKVLNEAILKYI